jgi:hypothetical protein
MVGIEERIFSFEDLAVEPFKLRAGKSSDTLFNYHLNII